MDVKRKFLLLFGGVATVVLFLNPSLVLASTQITGDILQDQTWGPNNGPYIVSNSIDVYPDVTLTILPGTEIQFRDQGRISVRGSIVANGAAENHIVFAQESVEFEALLEIHSEDIDADPLPPPEEVLPQDDVLPLSEPEPVSDEGIDPASIEYGDTTELAGLTTGGIILNGLSYDGTRNGEFSYVDFNSTYYGIVADRYSVVTIDHSSFSDIGFYPIQNDGGDITVTNSSFSDGPVAGMIQGGTFVHDGNTFATDIPGWQYGITVSEGQTVRLDSDDGVYYLGMGRVNKGGTLVIDPGVTFFVPDNEGSESSFDIQGTFIMEGTADNPIIVYGTGECSSVHTPIMSSYRWAELPDPSVTISHTHFKDLCGGIETKNGTITINDSSFEHIASDAVTIKGEASADLRHNWWGSDSGPTIESNLLGGGAFIMSTTTGSFSYCPWVGIQDTALCPESGDPGNPPGDDDPDPLPVPTDRDPVIIIPGISGTELSKNYDDQGEVWLNILKLTANKADSQLDELNLLVDGTESTFRPMVTGDVIRSVSDVDVFEGLVAELVRDGYTEGVDLFFVPYDWRLSSVPNATKLQEKIQQVSIATGKPKVDLIAHSMGGILAKEYVAQYGKDHVDQLFFLGTPHTGTPKAFKTLMYGDDMGISLDLQALKISLLNQNRVKEVVRNMPSVYELLPSKQYMDTAGPYVADLTHAYVPDDDREVLTFLNQSQTEKFMAQQGRNDGFFEATASLHTATDNLDLSGIGTYNFAACGATKTIDTILIRRKRPSKLLGLTLSNEYELSYGAGDSVVPLESATAVDADQFYYVKGANHSAIPSVPEVSAAIVSLLNGGQPTVSTTFSQSEHDCAMSGKSVSIHSPMRLDIYGDAEEHTGPTHEGEGDIEYGISGISYDMIDGEKFVFLPEGTAYNIFLTAEDIGIFDINIDDSDDSDVITKKRYYYNVPIAGMQTTAYLLINADGTSDYVLHIDQDGDGIYESARFPVTTTGAAVNDTTPPTTIATVTDATVSLTATDIDTGVLETLYSTDGTEWHHYGWPLTVTEDTDVSFFSLDNLGNTEETKMVSLAIESGDPEQDDDPNDGTDHHEVPSSDSDEDDDPESEPGDSEDEDTDTPTDEEDTDPVGGGEENPDDSGSDDPENHDPGDSDDSDDDDNDEHSHDFDPDDPGEEHEDDENSEGHGSDNPQEDHDRNDSGSENDGSNGENPVARNVAQTVTKKTVDPLLRQSEASTITNDIDVQQYSDPVMLNSAKESGRSLLKGKNQASSLIAAVGPVVSTTPAILIAAIGMFIGIILFARRYYKKVKYKNNHE